MYNGRSPLPSPPRPARRPSVPSRLDPERPGISPASVRIFPRTSLSKSSTFFLCVPPYPRDLRDPPSFRIPDLSLALARQEREGKSRLVSRPAKLPSATPMRSRPWPRRERISLDFL